MTRGHPAGQPDQRRHAGGGEHGRTKAGSDETDHDEHYRAHDQREHLVHRPGNAGDADFGVRGHGYTITRNLEFGQPKPCMSWINRFRLESR